jgi:hypothetical protein
MLLGQKDVTSITSLQENGLPFKHCYHICQGRLVVSVLRFGFYEDRLPITLPGFVYITTLTHCSFVLSYRGPY